MQGFTDLRVRQRGHSLVLSVYGMTTGFPQIERYGLISQLRRAAVSVPTNVAEGSKRLTGQEYAQFLNIAEGSSAETEYLLMASRDLGYITPAIASKAFDGIAHVARLTQESRIL